MDHRQGRLAWARSSRLAAPGGGELFISLVDELLEVDEHEFEVLDALLELRGVGGGAEAGCAPGPAAECLGHGGQMPSRS